MVFGSTVIAKLLQRWPGSVFVGSFVLFVVAVQMILKEPVIGNHVDPLHDVIEHTLPWLAGIVLTAKQYYRARIRGAK